VQYKFYQGIADKYLNSSIMQHSRHKESNYSKHIGHYDSIIRIHILRSDSVDACTRGGLYCSAEPLPMGFTLPCTRLTFKHLRPLSCQRLRPLATLTTWVSLLYMRLTAYLNPYLNIYTTRHHEVSPRDSWNYAYHIQFSCLPYHNHHFHLIHSILISPNHHVQFHTITHTKHTNSRAYIFQEFMHFQVIQPTHR